MFESPKSRNGEVNFGKLSQIIFRKIWLIIIVACITGAAVYVYLNNQPDTYTAYATMYVYTNDPNQINYQYASQSDLNTASRLAETYMVVIKSNKVMEAVCERLGPGYSAEIVADTINVETVSDTEVMRIASTTGNPELSKNICNAVAEFAPPEIIRVVNAGSVEVIDYATTPLPNEKGLVIKVILGGGLGVMLVCVILFLFFLFDSRIETEEDLKSNFNIPVLAALPNMDHRAFQPKGKYGVYGRYSPKRGKQPAKDKVASCRFEALQRILGSEEISKKYIITEETSPMIVEAYKMLRANLSFTMYGAKRKVILVASALPAEGKSTVSANLAIVMAQQNQKVLLIDADMRKHKRNGMTEKNARTKKGLSSVLLGETTFSDVVISNVYPGLDILSSGVMPLNPSELIFSGNMRKLIKRLRNEYSFIVIDTPPVNMVVDSLGLAKQVAGVVFVVKHHTSTLKETTAAIDAIRFTGMNILGFVLTNSNSTNGFYKVSKYYSKYNAGYYGIPSEPQEADQNSQTT